MTPVTQRVEIPHVEARLDSLGDVSQSPRNFASDERLAATRAFVIEQDSIARIHPVTLTVVHRDPVCVQLGNAIRAARIKWCLFGLRSLLNEPEQFRSRGLIEAGFLGQLQETNRFENSQSSKSVDIGGVFGALE